MSSTISQSGNTHSHVDRKALKRPDGFFVLLKKFFDGIGGHTRGLLFVIGTIATLSAVGVFLMTQHNAREEAARSALYEAQKTLESEYKAFAAKSAPQAVTPQDTTPAAAQANKKKEMESIAALLYKKLDVDTVLAGAVAKLRAASEKFSGTRAGFEATLELGDLYLNHGQAANAVPVFEKALSSGPSASDQAAAGSGLGHSYEDSGKFAEAAKAYEEASLKPGTPFKGDLLLSLARAYELMKDNAKAKSTYDQIISQMPTTEYARTAETRKAELE